jgi:hypothetical protein
MFSVKLAQLAETLYYIWKGSEFKLRSSHISTLRMNFIATRLLDVNTDVNIIISKYKYLNQILNTNYANIIIGNNIILSKIL